MASSSSLIALLVVLGCAAAASAATTFTVGDAQGWTIGPDYTTWVNGKSFAVGDKLLFNFAGTHTVTEVTKADYDNCAVSGNSISDTSSSPATIDLATAGAHYFICTVGQHCTSGMKVAVTVAASSSGTPPTPPSTTPGTTPTPTTPGMTPPPTTPGTTPPTTPASPSTPTGASTRVQAGAVLAAAAGVLVKLAVF
ncbi:hypothetical protein GUJ93_ZPchr0008g13404 [Zizania palustris]|uniref:Phytocyanin domain-containing protein n=1 Tax=Zizania palustris TaxID=103762 RepID=A0A8J5V4S1_ZIZPA|nr:hypothetical protein GUJ93_ZPchr0008g13404 [Zizania palustris]